MKKLIVGIAAFAVFAAANAQTDQNDWMVGGHFRLNTSDNNTQIAFTPNAGVFLVDNLAFGEISPCHIQNRVITNTPVLALGPLFAIILQLNHRLFAPSFMAVSIT